MPEHNGHRKRRRELYRATGGEGWEDARLLELLLFRAIPRGDVYPLARRLTERFGSLNGVLTAAPEELMEERGVGEKTARFLTSAKGLLEAEKAETGADGGDALRASPPPRPVLRSPGAAGEFLLPYFAAHRDEALYLMALDGGYTFLGLRLAALGGQESVRVDLEEMVRISEALCPEYIIAAHNHPGGIALPSAADERATFLFRDALQKAGITLLDHIVVSGGDFVSLRENGILP